MPRVCKICSHPRVKQIEKAILGKLPYTQIASKFEAHYKSVEYHAKKHLQPIIEKANKQAEEKIVRKLLSYREEVNYGVLDKVKFGFNHLIEDLENATTREERLDILHELRGWIQEEAKLTGAYQKDRENDNTLEKVVSAFKDWQTDHPNVTEEETRIWLHRFARGGRVEVTLLAASLGIVIEDVIKEL